MYKLGIDVGGTNIDFAVVDAQDRLLYGHKILAEGDLAKAISYGLNELKHLYQFDLSHVSAMHLGTTLAINSLLERKSLYKVGLIRLAGHQPDFPPAYLWPSAYRESILAGFRTISGGREYNNESKRPLNRDDLLQAVKQLLEAGAESLALVGVFSPLYAEDERKAAELIHNELDANIPLSLSSQVGSLGYIERENTTLLNAALKKVLKEGFASLSLTLENLGFQGECFITQNNGTLFTLAEAIEFPVKTISSGPTNSLIGACKLSGYPNGLVVDIGGTSTDIGIIENGFPLYTVKGGQIAGIPCNLLAPDITALAIGGGSIIRYHNKHFTIGPDSLGPELFTGCQTLGGPHLTLYDVGCTLKAGRNLEAEALMISVLEQINGTLLSLVPEPLTKPVLLVGGGSENLPDYLLPPHFIRPPHYQIANAYGAALSEVAGQIDCLVRAEHNKETKLAELEEKAKALALKKGAKAESIRIIEKKILPLQYLEEPMHRVLITAAGRI
jgi:N-methylhydantoinase A/oxoprolinase/acetone carboxylase beta subunit